jgi:hypothetical protein
MRPRFSPEVSFGAILQAGVLVVTISGGVFGAYMTLRADLDSQNTEFRVAIVGHEARITMLERALEERATDDRRFQGEMRDHLAQITAAIADLRTQIVQKEDRR